MPFSSQTLRVFPFAYPRCRPCSL